MRLMRRSTINEVLDRRRFRNLLRRHVAQCEREPSRIAAKKLCRLLQKSRQLRKLVRKQIKNNVPRSSRIHCFAYAFSRERKKLLSGQVTFLLQITKKAKRLQVDSRWRRKQTAASQTSVFHFKSSKKRCKSSTKVLNANNSEAASIYKNLNHRMNYCKFNLCRDIEKNPGPTYIIDPSKR